MDEISSADADLKSTLLNSNEIDLASTPLNYERFKYLAQNVNISPEERIGFPAAYRAGFEAAIIRDITAKLDNFSNRKGTILDIGCGASPLTNMLLETFSAHELEVTLLDSSEMLQHIPEQKNIEKIPGLFPQNLEAIQTAAPNGYDYILCYSVLHYVFLDANIFYFLDALISLLKPGGTALIGDIPNISKRKRFFSSSTGKEFHKQFMQTEEEPIVDIFKIEFTQIDDGVLAGMIQRAQNFGCDAYLMPQAKDLPMHNRRDDLVIRKL